MSKSRYYISAKTTDFEKSNQKMIYLSRDENSFFCTCFHGTVSYPYNLPSGRKDKFTKARDSVLLRTACKYWFF